MVLFWEMEALFFFVFSSIRIDYQISRVVSAASVCSEPCYKRKWEDMMCIVKYAFFLKFTMITLHLNDAYCKGTVHPGRGRALRTKSERVFAATSAVFC